MGHETSGRVVVHTGVRCDCCHIINLVGKRYKCIVCPDYDLCDTCIASKDSMHTSSHQFVVLCKPVDSNSITIPVLKNRSNWIHNFNCSFCHLAIVGFRYNCPTCPINLCESCELIVDDIIERMNEIGVRHTPDHILMKIGLPRQQHVFCVFGNSYRICSMPSTRLPATKIESLMFQGFNR